MRRRSPASELSCTRREAGGRFGFCPISTYHGSFLPLGVASGSCCCSSPRSPLKPGLTMPVTSSLSALFVLSPHLASLSQSFPSFPHNLLSSAPRVLCISMLSQRPQDSLPASLLSVPEYLCILHIWLFPSSVSLTIVSSFHVSPHLSSLSFSPSGVFPLCIFPVSVP